MCYVPFVGHHGKEKSLEDLRFVRQLVCSNETKKKTRWNSFFNVTFCAAHNAELVLWCNKCQVSICNQCLIEDHKTCDWVLLEKITSKLQLKLKESITTARSILQERFFSQSTENVSKLIDIRDKMKELQCHEKTVVSFGETLSAKQERALQFLQNCERILSYGSVNELRSTISEVLSLFNDIITAPKIPKFEVVKSEEPEGVIDSEAAEDREYLKESLDGKASEERTLCSSVSSAADVLKDLG